jgi:septal ring factor EnvC (AmiA/AmiB activator)
MNLKRLNLQAQMAALQAELASAEKQLEEVVQEDEDREHQIRQDRAEIAKSRGA